MDAAALLTALTTAEGSTVITCEAGGLTGFSLGGGSAAMDGENPITIMGASPVSGPFFTVDDMRSFLGSMSGIVYFVLISSSSILECTNVRIEGANVILEFTTAGPAIDPNVLYNGVPWGDPRV